MNGSVVRIVRQHSLRPVIRQICYGAIPRPSSVLAASRHALNVGGCRRVGTQADSVSSSGSKAANPLRPFFTLLLAFGVGAVAYGVYDIYNTLTLWPPEVRGDLRGALRAKYKGDLELSKQYFERAWDTAKAFPEAVFEPQTHLKTSGIAICLADVLESSQEYEDAVKVYEEALQRLQDVGIQNLSGPEKLRAVSIAYRLGEIAQLLNKPEDQERHLAWAVETILKSVMDEQAASHPQVHGTAASETRTMITELELPSWATTLDVAAPFEALGSFYADSGNVEYAMPLYLHAISILIPPAPKTSSAEDRCRGAQLMSNLSELIVRSPENLTPEILHQAEAWAAKALDIATQTKKDMSPQHPTCEVAMAVALYNLGAIRQMSDDPEKAKQYFMQSLRQAKEIGMQEGVMQAQEALDLLRTEKKDSSSKPSRPESAS